MNENDTMNDVMIPTGDEIDRILAMKPSERSVDEWIFLAYYNPSVMEEKGFPSDRMSLETWKDYILDNPIFLQYNPPVGELRKILTKEDFEDWESYDICQAVLFEGEWLAEEGFLPMKNVTQEDFDNFFGAEVYTTAEEFWQCVPDYFPEGFPPHIKLPYLPPEDKDEDEN